MPDPFGDPKPLPTETLKQLATLARITVNPEVFGSHLSPIFTWFLDWHRYDLAAPKRRAIQKRLDKVETAAARLLAEINQLDEGGVRALGLSALRCSLFGNTEDYATYIFQTNDLIRTENGLARGKELLERFKITTDAIRQGAHSYQFRSSTVGGRPPTTPTVPGNPRTPAEDLFILEVFRCVHRCGGHLTVNKNDGTGTAVSFFALAPAHLPDTCRLKGLSASSLCI